MVGDNRAKDIAGAVGAGWRSIWVHGAADGCGAFDLQGAAESTAEADASVAHVAEVAEVLLRWEKGADS